MTEIDNHLSFWENDCNPNDFHRWCGRKSWKDIIAAFIVKGDYKSVLDIGCGTGVMYETLQDMKYPHLGTYTGIDITPKWVSLCKSKKIRAFVGDCRNLHFGANSPIPDSSYEFVLSLDVLNHQTSFEESINEAVRVASKAVLFSFFKGFESPARIEQRYEHLIYHFFNKEEIENFLKDKNLKYMWLDPRDGIPNSSRPHHLFILL